MRTAIKACKKVKGKKDTFCTGGIGGSSYFEFKLNEIYELPNPENLELCNYGFHYFRKKDLCFGIDLFQKDTVFIEIEILGKTKEDTYKKCTNKFKALKYIPKKTWKKLIKKNYNSGNWNSGYSNSGNYNSGNYNSGNSNSGNSNSGDLNSGDNNSGYWNSGDYNSGDLNSGNWNSCNRETGFFNIKDPEIINIFGKPCSFKLWENTIKPKFLYFAIEKDETYKEAFQKSWKKTTENDKKLLEKLPNFDWEIFTEISGIEKPK